MLLKTIFQNQTNKQINKQLYKNIVMISCQTQQQKQKQKIQLNIQNSRNKIKNYNEQQHICNKNCQKECPYACFYKSDSSGKNNMNLSIANELKSMMLEANKDLRKNTLKPIQKQQQLQVYSKNKKKKNPFANQLLQRLQLNEGTNNDKIIFNYKKDQSDFKNIVPSLQTSRQSQNQMDYFQNDSYVKTDRQQNFKIKFSSLPQQMRRKIGSQPTIQIIREIHCQNNQANKNIYNVIFQKRKYRSNQPIHLNEGQSSDTEKSLRKTQTSLMKIWKLRKNMKSTELIKLSKQKDIEGNAEISKNATTSNLGNRIFRLKITGQKKPTNQIISKFKRSSEKDKDVQNKAIQNQFLSKISQQKQDRPTFSLESQNKKGQKLKWKQRQKQKIQGKNQQTNCTSIRKQQQQ